MTLANQITITRMLLVPVFAVLAIAHGHSVALGTANHTLRWAALGVFILAAASDGLDGWIARHFNQRSKLGALLDPIADKALMLTGITILSLVDWGVGGWRIPYWFAALVIVRDVVILSGIGILRRAGRPVPIVPHWTGKVCTFTQMVALGWVMLRVVPLSPVYPALVASLFTVWSLLAYLREGLRILRQQPVAPAKF